jgi:hypothetical protein
VTAWCSQCGEGSRVLPLEDVVRAYGMHPATLNRWLIEGLIHSQVSKSGVVHVCLNTLSAFRAREEANTCSNSVPPEKSLAFEDGIGEKRETAERGPHERSTS